MRHVLRALRKVSHEVNETAADGEGADALRKPEEFLRAVMHVLTSLA